MRSSLAPRLQSACTLPSTRTRPSGCGGCYTDLRGSSGMRRACGLWRWPPRPPSKRASPKRGSRGRPSAPPSRVFWAYAGSGPSGGSPPQIPCTKEKKAARPTDGDSRRRPSVGHRLFGRMLVEPGGAAHFERLLRGERAPSHEIQQSVAKDDPEPKAISCYGLYLPRLDDIWIRFVDGRPVSSITTRFLSWCCEELERLGKKTLLLIWDNASWHISREVRRWLGKHNREVKESGCGVRIVSCLLPKQSPWLNSI